MTEKEYLKQMGERIKAARMKKGIYLRDFAPLCGLEYSGLCRIENGQYSSKITTLRRIADALGIDIKDLV